MKHWLVVVAALAACGKGSKQQQAAGSAGSAAPAVDPARCTAAVHHAFAAKPHELSNLLGRDTAGLAQLEAIYADHCAKDHWDASAIACFEKVTDETGVISCKTQLAVAQGKAIDDDVATHPPPPPPKVELPFTVEAPHQGKPVQMPQIDTAFGKLPGTVYVGYGGGLDAPVRLAIREFELPAADQGKPAAVFAAEKKAIAKDGGKLDKDADVQVASDPAHDVRYTRGATTFRERWIVHGNQLWELRTSWANDAPEDAVADKFITSFALAK